LKNNNLKTETIMGEKVICIYHSRDLDGWMSAAIVKLWYDQDVLKKQTEEAEKKNGSFAAYPTLELIGWDYGQPIPNLHSGEQIIMVDICFPKETMQKLGENGYGNLRWIDHHISAIKEMKIDGFPEPSGLRNIHFAACELTWKYLFPDDNMPEIVRLLGRYDCFGHKGTDEELKVLEFQYGARASLFDVDTCYQALKDWNENLEHTIQVAGYNIYNYLCTEAESSYKKIFPVELDGYKFACVNRERFNPINFGIDYHKDGYDGFACFWYEDGQFSYSLYNDNGEVDCSVIAKNRGGGGHKGASGFRSSEIIK